MNRLHILIGCAGVQKRWKLTENGHQSTALKQLVPVYGQPLLHRSIRQYRRYLKPNFITIVGNDARLANRWAVLREDVQPSALPDSCIGSCMPYMESDEDNWMMMGDVCWTDAAAQSLASLKPDRIWFVGRSRGIGRHLPEIFAVFIPGDLQKPFLQAVAKSREVLSVYPNAQRGWLCYRFLHGLEPDRHVMAGDFLEIEDDTEDFDWPDEYIGWLLKQK